MKNVSEEEAIEIQLGAAEEQITVFLFKHFPSQDASGFDCAPRLVKSPVASHRRSIAVGHGKIKFEPSKYDPWHEVEVVNMIGASYTIGNQEMLKGELLTEAAYESFKPYSYLKWDS